jgi:hypothetical protein
MRHDGNRLGVIPSSDSRLPGIEELRAIATFSIVLYQTRAFASPSG